MRRIYQDGSFNKSHTIYGILWDKFSSLFGNNVSNFTKACEKGLLYTNSYLQCIYLFPPTTKVDRLARICCRYLTEWNRYDYACLEGHGSSTTMITIQDEFISLQESIPRLFTEGNTIITTHCAPAFSQVVPFKPQGVWARGVEAWAGSRDLRNWSFGGGGLQGPPSLMFWYTNVNLTYNMGFIYKNSMYNEVCLNTCIHISI